MTPRFRRVGRLAKGYNTGQVDAYLAAVEAALAVPGTAVSAEQIRKAGFDLVRRGYDVGEVDARLDELEEQALRREAVPEEAGTTSVRSPAQVQLDALLAAPYGARFARVKRFTRGYHPREVDDFLDQLALSFDAGTLVTAEQVRAVVFHARRGGYSEDAVDDLLDKVVDQLLRQAA